MDGEPSLAVLGQFMNDVATESSGRTSNHD